jgi:uncharacterized protein (DUF1800 family)
MKMTKKEIQHLYWRAGFGIQPGQLKSIENQSREEIVDALFSSSKKFIPLDADLGPLITDRNKLSKQKRKELNKLDKKNIFTMNVLWMQRMAETEAILREKMTFFFHDHFAVRINSPHGLLHLNNIVREHALGSFSTMLMEVSKSPAMISFLNNKQNKKSHPNENFAREVMELFTLGRDNGYTEIDIQEAARSFTGWSFSKEGKFVFNERAHDTDSKTFLGETGNFKGEDIIEILLKQKQTARYLTEKLIGFLISRPLSKEQLENFTGVFYDSGYNLSTLIRSVFLSDEFMAEESIGCRIKSPTELLVGITKQFKIEYQDPKPLIKLQAKLNQVLFFPPNVAGWQSGKGWIDSSTLMLRMQLSAILLNFGVIAWDEDGDTPEEANEILKKQRSKMSERVEKRFKAYPDWKFFETEIKSQESRLIDYLIQPKLSAGAKATIANSTEFSVKERAIELVSLPEYQLC